MVDDFTIYLTNIVKKLKIELENKEGHLKEYKMNTNNVNYSHLEKRIDVLFMRIIEIESHIDTRTDRKTMQVLMGILICSTVTGIIFNIFNSCK